MYASQNAPKAFRKSKHYSIYVLNQLTGMISQCTNLNSVIIINNQFECITFDLIANLATGM